MERVVAANTAYLKDGSSKCPISASLGPYKITVFHAKKEVGLPIRTYLTHLAVGLSMDGTTLVSALIYMDRLMRALSELLKELFLLTTMNAHRYLSPTNS